jgi:hypothetical protein
MVKTLALTLTLSPEEREQLLADFCFSKELAAYSGSRYLERQRRV